MCECVLSLLTYLPCLLVRFFYSIFFEDICQNVRLSRKFCHPGLEGFKLVVCLYNVEWLAGGLAWLYAVSKDQGNHWS